MKQRLLWGAGFAIGGAIAGPAFLWGLLALSDVVARLADVRLVGHLAPAEVAAVAAAAWGGVLGLVRGVRL
jgi:hypothetical protein